MTPEKREAMIRHLTSRGYTIRYVPEQGSPHVNCGGCGGTGVAYRFEDRDPVEGYKMADKKACLECLATGLIPVERVEASYDLYVQAQAKKLETETYKEHIRSIINQDTIDFIKRHM